MYRKFIVFLLLFILAVNVSFCELVSLCEDLSGAVSVPYDDSDPSSHVYTCSWRYPQLADDDEFSRAVNAFYQKKEEDAIIFDIPILAECMAGYDFDIQCETSYSVTCSNDDYISFLFTQREASPEYESLRYFGHTFSRKEIKPDSTVSLPYLLGILQNGHNDTWLQDRQTAKADSIVRDLVWDMIDKNDMNYDYFDWISYDYFTEVFFPEEDFYLNSEGNPVFFILPGEMASEKDGLLTFEILLEDISDEM